MEEMREANAELKNRMEDAEDSVRSLTLERDECVGKASSSPQRVSDGDLAAAKEALAACQSDMASKQAEFDAELITMKESHAVELQEAQASRVQVEGDGTAINSGSEGLIACQAELDSAKEAFSTNTPMTY